MKKKIQLTSSANPPWKTLNIVAYILGALLLFIFAIDLMIASVQHLSKPAVEAIINTTSNPFAGLFIGMLITAMIQSSSTTTTMTLAMVVSGSLTLTNAIPILMGANVGTTITAVIVSLGFINKKNEFRRAVSAGSYHYFFNLLTLIVLFPAELVYGFLSNLSRATAAPFSSASQAVGNEFLLARFTFLGDSIATAINNEFILIPVSFFLLLLSILVFRRIISDLLKANAPERFSKFFFLNGLKSFLWGVATTAAIRSSTITTSVVVAIVAKRIATLRQAAPFIVGANIGTTITIMIAAILNARSLPAISLAMAHILFNVIGMLLFLLTPYLRKFPLSLAGGLGKLTQKNRLIGFLFLLLMFFIIPFTLIFVSRA